ncbi:MAG TPA: hypothetical protein VGQ75_01785, partial [Thermoanaerobaculia bacterium]|nr:hypothetical protein [Thermoanaerobaculia bacterium]
ERSDQPTLRGITARSDAQLLAAAQMRHAAILRDPEDDGLDDLSRSLIPEGSQILQQRQREQNRRKPSHGAIVSDSGPARNLL